MHRPFDLGSVIPNYCCCYPIISARSALFKKNTLYFIYSDRSHARKKIKSRAQERNPIIIEIGKGKGINDKQTAHNNQ
jgi:hypothetical protein